MDNYLCIRSINLMIAQTAEFILLGLRHARGVVERRFLEREREKEEGEERRKSPSPVFGTSRAASRKLSLHDRPSKMCSLHDQQIITCLTKAFFIPFSEEQQVQASKKI